MSRAPRLLLITAVLLLALTPIGVASQASVPEPFALAVVREDGILVPIARFDATEWQRIWAEPAERLVPPASLQDVPATWFSPDGHVPGHWYLWLIVDPRAAASPFEARAATPVTIAQPVEFNAHCLSQIGLKSDYRGAEERQGDAASFPKPKAGLALTRPSVRVEQTTMVDVSSALAKAVSDRAIVAFHRAEDDHLENLESAERVGLRPFAERRAVPVRWTKMARLGTAQAPSRTYYLEGEIAYSPRSVMTGHVWIQIDGGRETTDAEAVLTDEDQKESKTRSPLGVVRVGDRRFWIFETSQWESEAYEIIEVAGAGRAPVMLIEIGAGGC
jgi:hypothetical protein